MCTIDLQVSIPAGTILPSSYLLSYVLSDEEDDFRLSCILRIHLRSNPPATKAYPKQAPRAATSQCPDRRLSADPCCIYIVIPARAATPSPI